MHEMYKKENDGRTFSGEEDLVVVDVPDLVRVRGPASTWNATNRVLGKTMTFLI